MIKRTYPPDIIEKYHLEIGYIGRLVGFFFPYFYEYGLENTYLKEKLQEYEDNYTDEPAEKKAEFEFLKKRNEILEATRKEAAAEAVDAYFRLGKESQQLEDSNKKLLEENKSILSLRDTLLDKIVDYEKKIAELSNAAINRKYVEDLEKELDWLRKKDLDNTILPAKPKKQR